MQEEIFFGGLSSFGQNECVNFGDGCVFWNQFQTSILEFAKPQKSEMLKKKIYFLQNEGS
jgi:hypothetical protein